jgi:hypothetical protein
MKRPLKLDANQHRNLFPMLRFSRKSSFKQNFSTLKKVEIPDGYISLEAFMEHVHREIDRYHAEKNDYHK